MKLLIPIISCLLLLGCQEYEFADMEEQSSAACGTKAENLPWLRKMIDQSQNDQGGCQVLSVDQGKYDGQTVFIPYLSGALCCTCGNVVYDCQGEVVFVCEPDKEKKIKKRRRVWERK